MLPQPFGNPSTYAGHSGVDYPQGTGTPIRASGNGTVVYRGWLNGNAGYSTQVRYDGGPTVLYCHQPNLDRVPGEGTRVGEGSVIGQVGSTGRSTGPHLHMEIMVGSGAHTYSGIWNHFSRTVIGGNSNAPLGGQQRRTTTSLRYRTEATSSSGEIDLFPEGTVVDVNGWKHGENVDGDDRWVRGAHSGGWLALRYLSPQNVDNLEDLNPKAPVQLGAGQRRVAVDGLAYRREATANSDELDRFPKGTVVDVNAWKHGQDVEGDDRWARGAHTGGWLAVKFLEPSNVDGLQDVNPAAPSPAPAGSAQRKVLGSSSVNGRNRPTTDGSTVNQSLAAGTLADFKGFVNGQVVEGNGVWFVGLYSGDYFWSGGFEGGANTAGLPNLDGGSTPAPQPVPTPQPEKPSSNNPRGLKTYTPVYKRAAFGLEAPYGFNDDGTRASRKTKGNPPVAVSGVIDRLILHWTGVLEDQLDWFSYRNSRSVCPNLYARPSGQLFELVRPGAKAATTGPEWNWRSIAIEVQMVAGPKPITDECLEELAQLAAEMARHDGRSWDGAPVSFKLDRTHIIGHRDAAATECPGDYLYGNIDWIIARAKQILAADGGATPSPEPQPEPSTPGDTVEVDRGWLTSVFDRLKAILGR